MIFCISYRWWNAVLMERKEINSEYFDCGICRKHIKEYEAFVLHLRSHYVFHPFKCDICGRGYRKLKNLRLHQFKIHDAFKPFTCMFCSATFSDIRDYASHQEHHNPCRRCLTIFPQHFLRNWRNFVLVYCVAIHWVNNWWIYG